MGASRPFLPGLHYGGVAGRPRPSPAPAPYRVGEPPAPLVATNATTAASTARPPTSPHTAPELVPDLVLARLPASSCSTRL